MKKIASIQTGYRIFMSSQSYAMENSNENEC